MRILTVALSVVLVAMLLACGGGGSSESMVPPQKEPRENNTGSVRNAPLDSIVAVDPVSLAQEARADKAATLKKYRGKFIELSATMYESGVHYEDGPYATLSTADQKTVVGAWFDRTQEKAALAIKKEQKTHIRGKNLRITVHDDSAVHIHLEECIILPTK